MSKPKLTEGALSVYQFDAWRVRILDRNGEPWWVLADICDALGLSNPSVVASRLADDERAKLSLGRQGEATIVNESGLYEVILRSDKPDAKRFRTWITREVLPSIRKTGAYTIRGKANPSKLPAGTQLREIRLIYGPEEARKRVDLLIGYPPAPASPPPPEEPPAGDDDGGKAFAQILESLEAKPGLPAEQADRIVNKASRAAAAATIATVRREVDKALADSRQSRLGFQS